MMDGSLNRRKGRLNSPFSTVQIIIHVLLWILLFLLLYPFGLLLWNSFKGINEAGVPPWIPALPLWFQNYAAEFSQIWRYIVNTLFVGVVGTAGLVIQASIGAYVFARLQFIGKALLYYLVIGLMMVPGILSLVPAYVLYNHIGMLNTYWVLIIPMWATGPSFGVFLLRQFFSAIPEDLFEAARMDGANKWTEFLHICVPLSIPILITLSIISIVGTWNDLVWPLITISSNHLLTISAGLLTLFGGQSGDNPGVFAAYVMACIPLIVFFSFTSQYYIEGLTSSAIKL